MFNSIIFLFPAVVLVPVNEYKIADKIIAANKSLFEESSEATQEETMEDKDKDDVPDRNKPRVTFSSDIEEYDDDDDNESVHSKDNESAMENVEKSEVSMEVPSVPPTDDANVIDDEPLKKEEENNVEINIDSDLKEDDAPSEPVETIEEICEDIDVIKLDPVVVENELVEEIIEEIYENITVTEPADESPTPAPHEMTESICEEAPTTCDQEEVSAGDEISSSIPMDIPVEPDTPKPKKVRHAKSAPETSNKPEPKSNMRKTSLNSVVRKGNLTPKKSENIKKTRPSGTIESARDEDLLKIQLNFKCCCEHKYLENERLPRYKGYFSQYGLSKEELEERAARKEEMKKMKYENWMRKKEEKQMKSQVNENAYAQWLKDKLRNVRNKEKNMYNVSRQKQKRIDQRVQHADSWK